MTDGFLWPLLSLIFLSFSRCSSPLSSGPILGTGLRFVLAVLVIPSLAGVALVPLTGGSEVDPEAGVPPAELDREWFAEDWFEDEAEAFPIIPCIDVFGTKVCVVGGPD